jgi:hypothetical protein
MREKLENTEYCAELNRKLDEVIAWAVLNCPIAEKNLAYADFEKTRAEFQKIAMEEQDSKPLETQNQPEPEEGGPQYINDNPAPWP